MAVLLAITNSITAPIIKENQDAAANEALLQVMPGGEGFEKIDISEKEIERCLEEKVDDYCIPQGSGFDLVLPVIGLFVPALIFLLKQIKCQYTILIISIQPTITH